MLRGQLATSTRFRLNHQSMRFTDAALFFRPHQAERPTDNEDPESDCGDTLPEPGLVTFAVALVDVFVCRLAESFEESGYFVETVGCVVVVQGVSPASSWVDRGAV